MPVPNDVNELLTTLVHGLAKALPDNLVGVYLRGSLATGDFIPGRSDVDVLVVTDRPVNADEFVALLRLHADIDASSNQYANDLEVAYLDREELRRFRPGRQYPTLYRGEGLNWREHDTNWVLERWVVREHGVALMGPDPKDLIDTISAQQIRDAVRARLRDWVAWADQPDDADWQSPLAHKAYCVETMCRALYALACGKLVSKAAAVDWAKNALPEPWASLVQRSQRWHGDQTVDLSVNPIVRGFIRWTAKQDEDSLADA